MVGKGNLGSVRETEKNFLMLDDDVQRRVRLARFAWKWARFECDSWKALQDLWVDRYAVSPCGMMM